jgi:hypothetical protein
MPNVSGHGLHHDELKKHDSEQPAGVAAVLKDLLAREAAHAPDLQIGGGAAQMAAHVADEICLDTLFCEAPLPVVPLEAVEVATADDGCSGRSGSA